MVVSEQFIKLLALVLYLLAMIVVGLYYYKKTETLSDYILGGRQIGKWTGALSAQASDMSGWLLMGLPGAAYLSGVEASWIAIGLILGTYANWKLVAERLRKYTQIAGDSLTLSDFFENRFKDQSHLLRLVSAVFIVIFFTVYTSAQFAAGGKLFNLLLGIEYHTALVIGAIVIVLYTLLGGFLAVCKTDTIQGALMFFALLAVPVMVTAELGGMSEAVKAMTAVEANYLSMFHTTGGAALGGIAIISSLAWGLGYFGQPHIITRFMAIKSSAEIKGAKVIAMVWVVITLVAAVFVGMLGRIYYGADITDTETVFMMMVNNSFAPLMAGILLASILAAAMSTADSQLLVTASAVSNDFYQAFINKKATEKQQIWVGRLTVVVVSIVAVVIAFDPNSSVFGLVSNAWAGFGAVFGPLVIMSLFWKRMNRAGAIAGMVVGGATVMIWNNLRSALDLSAGSILNMYELVPGLILSTLAIVIVSLMTKEPSQEICDEFDAVRTSDI